MKISINYTEVQTFQRNVDVELTKKQLAEFKKTGKLPFEITNEICSATDGLNHFVTECYVNGINQNNKY
jgi:hypothetical protein